MEIILLRSTSLKSPHGLCRVIVDFIPLGMYARAHVHTEAHMQTHIFSWSQLVGRTTLSNFLCASCDEAAHRYEPIATINVIGSYKIYIYKMYIHMYTLLRAASNPSDSIYFSRGGSRRLDGTWRPDASSCVK